jgi:ABC-2 type transport system ATP-binding protein
LDEPTSGLDVMSARNLRSMIRDLNQQGTTIFLTTHNIEEANLLCHRIAIIVKGRIIANDTPEALRRSVQEKFVIEIGVENPDSSDLSKWVKEMEGIEEVKQNQNRFILTFSKRPSLESLFYSLRERGIVISSVNTLQPTLEDAFVSITGLDKEIMMVDKEGKKV